MVKSAERNLSLNICIGLLFVAVIYLLFLLEIQLRISRPQVERQRNPPLEDSNLFRACRKDLFRPKLGDVSPAIIPNAGEFSGGDKPCPYLSGETPFVVPVPVE